VRSCVLKASIYGDNMQDIITSTVLVRSHAVLNLVSGYMIHFLLFLPRMSYPSSSSSTCLLGCIISFSMSKSKRGFKNMKPRLTLLHFSYLILTGLLEYTSEYFERLVGLFLILRLLSLEVFPTLIEVVVNRGQRLSFEFDRQNGQILTHKGFIEGFGT
jgi:hypothetical protein